MSEHDNQLHTARYAFHKVWCKVYADAVQRREMSVEEAREHYRRSMENYDQLIKEAGPGQLWEANEKSMKEGFPL